MKKTLHSTHHSEPLLSWTKLPGGDSAWFLMSCLDCQNSINILGDALEQLKSVIYTLINYVLPCWSPWTRDLSLWTPSQVQIVFLDSWREHWRWQSRCLPPCWWWRRVSLTPSSSSGWMELPWLRENSQSSHFYQNCKIQPDYPPWCYVCYDQHR